MLIMDDKVTPTAVFNDLLNTIFDIVLPSDPTNTAELLTPTRLAAVYDVLDYPLYLNLPFLLYRDGKRSRDDNPHFRVRTHMATFWRDLRLESGIVTSTNENIPTPGLTRKGFISMMVRDAVMYPVDRAHQYTAMMGRYRHRLEERGRLFPRAKIHARFFTPPGVPPTGDANLLMEFVHIQQVWESNYMSGTGSEMLWEGVPDLWDKKVLTAWAMNGASERTSSVSDTPQSIVSPTGELSLPVPCSTRLGIADTRHPLAGGSAHLIPDTCGPATDLIPDRLPKPADWGLVQDLACHDFHVL